MKAIPPMKAPMLNVAQNGPKNVRRYRRLTSCQPSRVQTRNAQIPSMMSARAVA
jgi:hypothetical protein